MGKEAKGGAALGKAPGFFWKLGAHRSETGVSLAWQVLLGRASIRGAGSRKEGFVS